MSVLAASHDRYTGRQTARQAYNWIRDYLCSAALADPGCGIAAIFAVAELSFANHLTGTYLILSLGLPILSLISLSLARGLAGRYDAYCIGTGSDGFQKVLNARVNVTTQCRQTGTYQILGTMARASHIGRA
jgi:hypothetical protein